MTHLPEKHKTKQGFSLLEISIVLTVIALLIGGVIAGQSIIRASELRAFTTQYQGIIAAVDAFKDKYSWIPGDMPDATGYWGAAAAGAACVTTASTTATCDGNGDKVLTDPVVGSQNSNELFRFWQHLALAGFIKGNYDGISHGTPTYATTVENAPAGKIRNSFWFAAGWGTLTSATGFFDGDYTNSLEFGTGGVDMDPRYPAFKPEELWNIDVKIDDGKPATGKLKIRGNALNACTDTSSFTNVAANYLTTSNTLACAAIFPKAYQN